MGTYTIQVGLLLLLVTMGVLEEPYNPDTYLSTTQLIVKYGYPVESHTVLTEDGYFLTLHRIPFGHKNTTQYRPAVFVQHGILCSSADWVILGPDKALGYVLADSGYDVWLGNARGNTYSRRHLKYTTQSREFWDFSFHEMGVFDLPAVVDYILKETGQKKLYYIGHSMGTTMFYILMSERPEYNNKIRIMVSLSPVAYLSHMTSPMKGFIATRGMDVMMQTLKNSRAYDFLPSTEPIIGVGRQLCRDKNFSKLICENILFYVGGFGTEQLNTSLVPVILGHVPAGTSAKTIEHYVQFNRNDKFCKYNYGKEKNTEIYGSVNPSSYNLKNVKVPVSLHYSDHDALSARADVFRLYKLLPNVIGTYRVPISAFNHLDFIWGKDARNLVYDNICKILRNY